MSWLSSYFFQEAEMNVPTALLASPAESSARRDLLPEDKAQSVFSRARALGELNIWGAQNLKVRLSRNN